jgi:hypothetical protein
LIDTYGYGIVFRENIESLANDAANDVEPFEQIFA